MGRKVITAADIRPFLAKTGQLHLLDGIQESPVASQGAPQRPSGAPSATPTAEVRVTGGKKRREMNQTEYEFSLILEAQRSRGEILLWEYEAITFRFGVLDGIRYTPDFTIFDSIEVDDSTLGVPRIQMRFIEVKGAFIHQKDALRFKAARNHFSMFRFELWQKTKEIGWTQQF